MFFMVFKNALHLYLTRDRSLHSTLFIAAYFCKFIFDLAYLSQAVI
jgi:hypothetical protein